MKKHIFILCAMLMTYQLGHAQQRRKVTFVGGARSVMNNSTLSISDTTGIADTATAKKNTGARRTKPDAKARRQGGAVYKCIYIYIYFFYLHMYYNEY